MAHPLAAHVPQWVLTRLKKGILEPGYARSSEAVALYADLAGFTSLTETMTQYGPQEVEVLSQILNAVFGTLAEEVYAYGGDVAWFAGDAVTAFWLPAEGSDARTTLLQAIAAAQAVQQEMHRFHVPTPNGFFPLAMRIGLGSGPATLMVVGNAEQQRFIFTGPALDRAIAAEKRAPLEKILLHESVRRRAGAAVNFSSDGSLENLTVSVAHPPPVPLPQVPVERLRPFVHPSLAERIESGQAAFLADFRHGLVPMFVSFAAQVPAEIQAYVPQAMEITNRHGGFLSEVEVGDKGNVLVILFGAPLSLGDHSVRAAACALDLITLPATQAIGATSGTMFAGVVGSERRRQYATSGDEMNLAARLMQTARQSQSRHPLLISARVRRLAGPRFIYGERQLLPVKGKSEPVAVVPLLGQAKHWEHWLSPWMGTEDLIDRQKELAQVQERIVQAMGRQGHVLTIVGEAGMGKSRLTGEILRRWLLRGGTALAGSASSAAQRDPYHVWGNLLRGFFDLSGDGGDVERIEASLEAINPDLLPRLPLLSDVLGLGLPDNDLTRRFDAQLRQQSTQMLLLQLMRHRAAQKPLLLILEDVHWMDRLSWRVALAISRAVQELPVLLCLIHRPLEKPVPGDYRALIRLPHHTRLELVEMRPGDTVQLACTRLGIPALPQELADLIRHKAQGHPFFTEEIINALQESEAIQLKEDHVIVQRDLSQVELPDTVQGVVQVRIDRLDEQTRLTLKVASVIGRTFPYHILYDVHPAGLSETELQTHLDLLERLDITPMEQLEPELTYIFKHAITQEVTYHTLSFAQRRALHQNVVQWYETAFGKNGGDQANGLPSLSAHLPLLVHHYHHAGDLENERRYARLAGEQAAAQYANEEAVTYLSRALELTPQDDVQERYTILLALERVHDLQGAREAQDRELTALQRLARALGDDGRRSEVALRRARFAQATGDYAAAISAAQAAIRLAQAVQDADRVARGHRHWGRVLWLQGNYDSAEAQLEQALNLSEEMPELTADVLRNLGAVCFYQNDYTKARAYLERALRICREINYASGENVTLNNLGAVTSNQGELIQAGEFFDQALNVCRKIGDRRGECLALSNRGYVWLKLADHSRALNHLQHALSISRETGYRRGEGLTLSYLALLAHRNNENESALEYGQQAKRIAGEIGDRSTEGRALNAMGQALAALGNLAEASAVYRQAIALRRELGQSNLAMNPLAGQARVALAQGKLSQALSLVEGILNHLEANTLEGADELGIYLTCYRVLRASQDPRADSVLEAAHARLQELASKIPDATLRRTFLENAATHQEIVQAFTQSQ